MTLPFSLSPGRRAFLGGTILLTGAGFACRILGFFYRIFLSRTIGAEGLGLYHMVHPVYGICFALCAGSIQTALSQYIASHLERGKQSFRTGLVLSLSLSCVLAWLICRHADFLARAVLLEPRCAPYLPLMGISVPFAAVHSCINGWYYGVRKTRVPAWSQVAEQILRMSFVFLLAHLWMESGRMITVRLAVIGHVTGEIGAAAFTILCIVLDPPQPAHAPADTTRFSGRASHATANPARFSDSTSHAPARVALFSGQASYAPANAARFSDSTSHAPARVAPFSGQASYAPANAARFSGRTSHAPAIPARFAADAAPLAALALPLMGSRLVTNLLASAEAIWIPSCLRQYGLTASEAFGTYGILTGMALPFVFFPSAITNSMAVLLLPGVAQAQAEGRQQSILASITLSLRYSMYMGILCIGIFVLFGASLGECVFHNATAGRYIQILAWLSPFLYLASTLGSILNGLGHTRATFALNTAALLIRIGFILVAVPRYGIYACLCGMLVSELFLALASLLLVRTRIPFSWNAWDMIGRPVFFLSLSIGIHWFLRFLLPLPAWIPPFFQAAIPIGVISFLYLGLLLLSHLARSGKDGKGKP